MSSILDDFDIFDTLWKELKNSVKLLHAFKPPVNEKVSAFFITKDDQVYEIGMNKCAALGLGHAQREFIPDHTKIPELCDQNICQFFHNKSLLCFFARSQNSQIFVWGSNFSINETASSDNLVKYVKPERIKYFDEKNILTITGVIGNYFALSSNGLVYQFNDTH